MPVQARHVKKSYEGAIPTELFDEILATKEIVETLKQTIALAPVNLQDQFTDQVDNVSNRLDRIEIGLGEVSKKLSKGERRELASLYIGVFLGALIGVIGNFFVSFWFQPPTSLNILGLIASFIVLLVVCIAFLLQAIKYIRERS